MAATRIFYATDIHGSDKCFLKFLNAGKFYKADVVVLGGDLTGKTLVPIFESPDGSFTAEFLAERVRKTKSELAAFEKIVNDSGQYPYHVTEEEYKLLMQDPGRLEAVFQHLAIEKVERWLDTAEERVGKQTGTKYYVTAGNDDTFEIDTLLKHSSALSFVEGAVVQISQEHEMIATGFANITPWHCFRDITEEELAEKIEKMTDKVTNMRNCVFTLHAPPYGSGLDTAMELDKDLKPIMRNGAPSMIPVGSRAVLEAVEKHQPLLGLHGHIHEARGTVTINRTVCINPGSEYSEGVLRGALIDLQDSKVKSYVLTSG
jgi:hypothetical protein